MAVTTGKFTWDWEGKSRSWTYYNGIMMDAYLMLYEGTRSYSTYENYVNGFYNANIPTGGTPSGYIETVEYWWLDEMVDSITFGKHEDKDDQTLTVTWIDGGGAPRCRRDSA